MRKYAQQSGIAGRKNKKMTDHHHSLPAAEQVGLLEISRSSAYYQSKPTSSKDLALMRRLDDLHLEFSFAGSRMLKEHKVPISMDGKGYWRDNVFVERVWRSIK